MQLNNFYLLWTRQGCPRQAGDGILQGGPDVFDRGPNLKIIFYLRPVALFKISDEKYQYLQRRIFLVLLILKLTVYDQNSGRRISMLLFS
jgi:hypothetical protein